MCSAVMKGLCFPYTQESCFDAWKRSHMGCYVVDLLIPKNRVFRLRNVQIWVSAVLEGGRSSDFHEFFFHAAKRSNMYCVEMQ